MEYKKIQSATFFILLVGVTLIFAWLLKPYIYPIFWAAVLASIFHPVYKKLLPKLKNKKNLTASLTLILAVLVVLIPLAAVASLVVKQSIDIYEEFGNKETFVNVSTAVQHYLELPVIKKVAGEIDIMENLIKWSSKISSFIYDLVASGSQNTIKLIVQFFIMLYALYFFIKEGDLILKKIMYLLPLGDKYEKLLYDRFVSTSRATLKGTMLIGLIQGLMGGMALFIVGVPGSAFWGLVMVLLCMIPSIGTFIILVPAAIILLILGNVWQAVVLLVIMAISSIVDNLLRTSLVGKDTQMHPLFIFFATIGGLFAFGITGVVIGPVITAFLLSMWQIYAQKYKADLERSD